MCRATLSRLKPQLRTDSLLPAKQVLQAFVELLLDGFSGLLGGGVELLMGLGFGLSLQVGAVAGEPRANGGGDLVGVLELLGHGGPDLGQDILDRSAVLG